MDFKEFSDFCTKRFCYRHSTYSERCLQEEKQLRCFTKWNKVKLKKAKRIVALNYEYASFVTEVWKQTFGSFDGFSKKKNWQKYCRIWNILTDDEKKYIEDNFNEDLWLNENLDVAHILPKDTDIDLKYNPSNGVILGRLFHQRLDSFKHPVTNEKITKEERLTWLQKAKEN